MTVCCVMPHFVRVLLLGVRATHLARKFDEETTLCRASLIIFVVRETTFLVLSHCRQQMERNKNLKPTVSLPILHFDRSKPLSSNTVQAGYYYMSHWDAERLVSTKVNKYLNEALTR